MAGTILKDSRVETLLEIGNSLFQEDWAWFNLAQDICENFYPMRADYTADSDISADYAAYIQDGTPVLFREELGNAIPAMLRQGNWFTVGSGDDRLDKRPEVQRSLRYATSLMRSTMLDRHSGWELASIEADHDWVSVGQPVMSIEEDDARTRFIFKAHHPKSVSWLCDQLGRPVAVFRKFRETARNIIKAIETGRYNGVASPELREAAKTSPSRKFSLMHVIIPADDLYAGDALNIRRVGGPWRHRYVNCYIDCEHRTYLHEGSLPMLNFVAPAYRRLSGQRRGFSPATFNAIGDARMLQSMALVILEQGEKAVDPPIVASGDIFRNDMNLFAGGTTFADLGDKSLKDVMTTVQTSEGVRLGVDLKQDVRNLIAESMLINKLTMPSVREMRELEVAARLDEFRRAALPFFTPLEQQYHTQILGLLFDMMKWRGMFPPGLFAPALQEIDEAKFTFTSPLNEADGRKAVEAYFNGIQIISAGKEVDETIGNLLKMRDAAVLALEGAGLDPEVIKTEDERAEADQQAKAQTDLTTAAKMGQVGAGVVADLANARLAAAQADAVAA